MEQLDVSDGFDVHEYRHGLKLVEQDRKTMHLENRQEFGCPACGKPFVKLYVTERDENTFGNPNAPLCLVRAGEEMLLVVHAGR